MDLSLSIFLEFFSYHTKIIIEKKTHQPTKPTKVVVVATSIIDVSMIALMKSTQSLLFAVQEVPIVRMMCQRCIKLGCSALGENVRCGRPLDGTSKCHFVNDLDHSHLSYFKLSLLVKTQRRQLEHQIKAHLQEDLLNRTFSTPIPAKSLQTLTRNHEPVSSIASFALSLQYSAYYCGSTSEAISIQAISWCDQLSSSCGGG
jgi:hypothetical protein